MTDTNTGKNLGKCFQVVSQAYNETNALISALSLFFDKKSSSKCAKKIWADWTGGEKLLMDNFSASWKLENKEGCYLCFQISLLGSGMNLGGNQEPLLHVFMWDTDKNVPDVNSEYCMSYDKVFFETKPDLWGDSLIVWPDKKGFLHQWTFSVRLAALSNKQMLEDHIVEPIEKLLENSMLTKDAYEKAPLNFWDGLVCYNTDKNGQLISIKAAGEK